MRESFVIHAEYIEDLPEDFKDTYLHYIYNYGIYDSEPAGLEGFEKSIWIKIKRRIDQDRNAYEERKKKNRKRQEEWRKKQGLVEEAVSEPSEVPSKLTPSQTEYSKQIFNVFKNAGLPCNKNNEISFMMQDFANGLSYIHKTPELKSVHSSDIIEACKNYVTVLNDSSCYITAKLSFFALVKSKFFYNLLPANFDKGNFKNFKKSDDKEQKESEIWYEEKPCSKCGQNRVIWHNDLSKYICESCHKVFTIGEF